MIPTTTTPRELTARQAEVLALIDATFASRGCGPTLKEIARAAGYTSPAGARNVVQALERAGFLARDPDSYAGQVAGVGAMRVLRRVDGGQVLLGGAWYEFVPAEDLRRE